MKTLIATLVVLALNGCATNRPAPDLEGRISGMTTEEALDYIMDMRACVDAAKAAGDPIEPCYEK